MAYQVIVLPRARRDLQQCFEWIAERSPEGANRWFEAFEEAARRLADHPDGYGFAAESELYPETIRQFLFRTRSGRMYRGLFVVRGKHAYVLHVRGPRQRKLRPHEIEGP